MRTGHLIAAATAFVVASGLAAVSLERPQRASAQAPAPPSRPNILVLETDDQTLAELEVMPNTRRLIGGQGVTFDNHFASFPVCCPSRATFLTGQYAHNNGVLGNRPPDGGYEKLDGANTLPVWLQQAGYYTVHLGKYLNGYGLRDPYEIPPGWSEWRGSVDQSTYRFYGYTLNENGVLTRYCGVIQPACYQTDVYRDKANEIIRRRAPHAQPFFLWVAFLANHSGTPHEDGDPRHLGTPAPAPRHADRFAWAPLPLPPSFNEADVSDKPRSMRAREPFAPHRIDAIRENWQQRRETLLAVDEAVASIVETLRATGELHRTLILFTSDNGFFHGEHRVAFGKVLPYEPSIRVPLLMRGPGVPRGARRSQLVANVDHAATILDAANVRPRRPLDGVSLLPLARDRGKELGRDILLENQPSQIHYDGIRTRRYKYVEYWAGDRELYDLARDPYELESQHENPAYARVRAALATRLRRLVFCSGRTCRNVPPVRLALSYRRGPGGCARSPVRVAVRGARIQAVGFRVRGRRVARDLRRPFAVTLDRPAVRGTKIRARVAVGIDRIVTLDRFVRACD